MLTGSGCAVDWVMCKQESLINDDILVRFAYTVGPIDCQFVDGASITKAEVQVGATVR